MPPQNCTTTHLRVTDIDESDDALQAAASTAEPTTPTVLAEAQIDHHDDSDMYDDLRGQRNKDSPIDNDSGDLCFQITDEVRLDRATETRLMLEMLLENLVLGKAEQRLEQERMLAERDELAAEPAECTERSTIRPRPNIYKIVEPITFGVSAKELDRLLDALHCNLNSHIHLCSPGGPDHI
jgi:hypothetical protein